MKNIPSLRGDAFFIHPIISPMSSGSLRIPHFPNKRSQRMEFSMRML